MNTNKIMKIAGLNIGIAFANIVIFSPGLLGIRIGGVSILGTAFGCTVILMSLALFVYGNYQLLLEKEEIVQTAAIKTTEDYIDALKRNEDKKTFAKEITIILEQIERLQKKQETICDILLQKFDRAEMSYQKFEGTIQAVTEIFYLNIKSVLNKLNAFDEDDYQRIRQDKAVQSFSKEFIQTKMDIYQEYISFVQKSMAENEEIILKLDKLLLEISRLNSLEAEDIANMAEMKEIDALIKQTQYYK